MGSIERVRGRRADPTLCEGEEGIDDRLPPFGVACELKLRDRANEAQQVVAKKISPQHRIAKPEHIVVALNRVVELFGAREVVERGRKPGQH